MNDRATATADPMGEDVGVMFDGPEPSGLEDGADPAPTFTHPLLPGYAFPREVDVIDVYDLKAPGRFDSLIAATLNGRAAAIYDIDGRPLGGAGGGRKVVLATLLPGELFKAE